MNDLEQHVRAALYSVAPDLEGEAIDPNRRFRDQFEFDSMDFLRYLTELSRRMGIEIPEADYRQCQSLGATVEYLATRSPSAD